MDPLRRVALAFLLLLPPLSAALSLDADILLRAKKAHLSDPNNSLRDWLRHPNATAPCGWSGVGCDPGTRAVTSIDLSSLSLKGEFPATLCTIPTLRNLSLADNYLGGRLWEADLARCHHLVSLNLSDNIFVGVLPGSLPPFPNLRVLDISQNNLSGPIPASLAGFKALQVLSLFLNFLNGTIPAFVTSLTELVHLNAAFNVFDEGPLPSDIGNLVKLETIWLRRLNLVGQIPTSIGALVNLRNLDLADNRLSGRIPTEIGGLKSIEQIELFLNQLSGELPETIGDLTTLRRLDVSQNNLTGRLPEKIAGLHLISLGLNDNLFYGEIPAALVSNPNLSELKLFNNSFSGEIPADLGRNSDLVHFEVSDNRFEGGFPEFLCYKTELREMIAFNNRFSGGLPASYGECRRLTYVRLSHSGLSGEVPERFWSLPEVYFLEISDNAFSGEIPVTISGARNLTRLLISSNNFTGELPPGICQLPYLTVIDASVNRFSGSLPACLTNVSKLEKLDLQENAFSGEITRNVASWRYLTELNLSSNRLSGLIPAELGDLPVLTYLDLSGNALSGEIPASLAEVRLNSFNLSDNRLSGRIPAGFDNEFFASSLLGNPRLCSEALRSQFVPCRGAARSPARTPKTAWFLWAVFMVLSAALIAAVVWFYRRKTVALAGRSKPTWKLTSFQRLGFKEEEILEHMTEENLVGSGSTGQVYRVRMKSGQTVAVKRLWVHEAAKTGVEAGFRAEVDALGSVRHGNIVKLLMCCTGEDLKVLVLEYLENGSLGEVLHGEKGGVALDWGRRKRIALGAAQGLAYLHHDCVPAIVHRDVKSNNILLDGDFCAKVADFGLARLLQEDRGGRVMSQVAGSVGYIAPEYAYTLKINEKSDVYSFGVVLLELLTGKRPVDPSFGENKDIVKWVTDEVASFQAKSDADIHRIFDPRLSPGSYDYEEMVNFLDVALLCVSAFPMNRPSMRKVVELLKDSRDLSLLAAASRKQ